MIAALKESITSRKKPHPYASSSSSATKQPKPAPKIRRPAPEPVQVTYASKQVAIPDDFLVQPAADSKPITFRQIDWAQTDLPEYRGAYAVVLDNVLSPSECRTLIALAEESVLDDDRVPVPDPSSSGEGSAAPSDDDNAHDSSHTAAAASNNATSKTTSTTTTTTAPPPPSRAPSSWRPAMVNIGGGYEILEPNYRNSDRIVWDQAVLIQRLWDHRLATVPQISADSPDSPLLSFKQGSLPGFGPAEHWDRVLKKMVPDDPDEVPRWVFVRMNKRMRFLKYGPGQFFRAHGDGAYTERDVTDVPGFEGRGVDLTTHFTVHVYLNDSQQAILDEIKQGKEKTDEQTSSDGSRETTQNTTTNNNSKEEHQQAEEERDRAALAQWEAAHNDGQPVSLVGGATAFLSTNEKRRVDVDPRAGRVLIFQQRRLYHAGDDVLQGVKYTMRAELLHRKTVAGE
ncbi:hypothetical protein Micbo1qcDRAFT_197710 [Microdochium bolleyi]|uniref:Prolyl 4-hydroxylase alpha subunit domain-containing protein n=1 Tax=Microdochium bolleyi TaxID=196109 RepID=A0A136IRY3_9PEZI|nr:hypothetical protein Micbo1qcDRAFT_197710 [Microdochium bolleyi]